MKAKKRRGHKRIWRSIEQWKDANLPLDLDKMARRETHERRYAKMSTPLFRNNAHFKNPPNGILLIDHQNSEPRGKTKKKWLHALFEVYEGWKKQLDKTDKPYYLSIWLFEPRVSQSQVVCAIGKSIDFYKDHFRKPENEKALKTEYQEILKDNIKHFEWDHRIEEEHLDNTGIGDLEDFETTEDYLDFTQRFAMKMKQPHETILLEKPIANITERYVFKRGNVWMGHNVPPQNTAV